MQSFAAMHKTGNTTATIAAAAGTAIAGLTAAAASRHGEGALTLDATNGKMTATSRGVYAFAAQASLETEDISGTSGDAAGHVGIALMKNGTLVAGTKSLTSHGGVDDLQAVAIPPYPLELEIDDYVQVCAVATDASGNDVTVRELQFTAIRIN